jgi:DNA processing protein
VIAGGIDVVYPPEHAKLQAQIAEVGCLVSENPPGFVARAADFPRRNRIVSGISHGVIVVEAARRSGTLTTARFANDQGREVFAVPGHPLDPRAEGTNHLIKSGAKLVTTEEDVLEDLAPILTPRTPFAEPHVRTFEAAPAAAEPPVGDGDRARVLEALGPAPVNVDEVVRSTGLGVRAVQIAILELALAGRVERHGGQLVSRLD